MRWAFWRKDGSSPSLASPPPPLPTGTGLPQPERGANRAPGPGDDDPVERTPVRGSRPSPSTDVPDLPAGSVPRGPEAYVLDRAWLAVVRDTVVDAVHELLAGEAAAVRTTTDLVRSRLAAATPDQEGLTVAASLAALSVRLPALAGVAGAPHENRTPEDRTAADRTPEDRTHADPDAQRLLLAYADLLAERAEPLRARTAPQVSREQVRLAAHGACGAPDADPALAPLQGAPAADQLLAACVLLAQTCLDGGGSPQDIGPEIDGAFGG